MWRGNRLQAILNTIIGLCSVAVSITQIYVMQHAIDVASGSLAGNVYKEVALMGVLILCYFAINILSVWVKSILGIKAQNRMQQYMLDRILRSEWHGRETRHSGDVLNRLEGDVGTVVVFLTETIPNTITTIVLFITAFVALFLMDNTLAIITIILVPLVIVVSRFYIGRMRKLTRTVRESDSKVQSVLQEVIQNRMLIKTLEKDTTMVNRLENTQSELRHNVVKRTKFSVISNFILNFGFSLGYLIGFLWAALRIADHTLSFGGMTAFLQLVNRIQGPARDLTGLAPAFVGVFTAVERLMELEEEPLEEQGDPIPMGIPCGIRFLNISYKYSENEENVIKNLSFDFRPGSCTAILGETGAGKTTLVRIMLALLHPQKGSVEMYDTNKSLEMSPLMRCNLVYVPQGNTLMSGTIRDNLRLGNIEATDDEMGEALKKSCAEFVFDLPDKLDTMCAERGGGLSEGQAQRIAIARALLRNRPIMLFDEATSALDIETERQLLSNLLSKRDKTIIFITHRPAVIEYCDRTLKVKRR